MGISPSSFIKDAAGSIMKGLGDLFTSDDERNKAAVIIEQGLNDVYKSILSFVAGQEKERSDRHKYDMNSDSWLSKNIRPLTLVFLTALFIALIIWDSMPSKPTEDIVLSAITVNELRLKQDIEDGSIIIPPQYIEASKGGFSVSERWIELLESLLMSVYGFYFLSRGAQACMQSYANMKTKVAGSAGLK